MSLLLLGLGGSGSTSVRWCWCGRSGTSVLRLPFGFRAIMSGQGHHHHHPNSNMRGRRGGGRGGGRGGEQRWWDPVWRAERLRQKAAEVERLNENEWWTKMQQIKEGGQQELIVKRNYGREGQQTLSDMAHQLGLYFHAYNKGKTLVVSKVPLPNYRADLDERHGSTQKEIQMSIETEKRVGNLLEISKGALAVHDSVGPSGHESKQSLLAPAVPRGGLISEEDSVKEKYSVELRNRQHTLKASQSVKAMQSFREQLPAYKVKAEFLKAVAENQVQEPDLAGVSHLIVDEIHERGINEDFLIIILRDLLPRRPDLRLILMSATINADLFSKYFGNAPTIHIPGRTFPVAEVFLEDVLEKTRYSIKSEFDSFQGNTRRRRRQTEFKKDLLTELFEEVDIDSHYRNYSTATRHSLEAWSGSQLDLGLVESTIEHICRNEGVGAILVFLTGWDDISKLLEKIKANSLLGISSKFLILPLHGSMPTVNQREIFDRPPNNMRKIVLATNIAESSITIDDVVYVIDCGKAKETSYDALNKLACLLPSWISKASAHQRRGRAGRVQPGKCYRLYPKIIYDAMHEYQLPEILRTPLQELCLHIKSLQLGTIASFLAKALQPPDPLSVENAVELLKTIGALGNMEELTPLGRHLCTLPLDPNIGKMLLMGCIFQCLDPALTIASALAHRDPFVLPINRKAEADAAKRSFAGDSCSDHIALLKAFEAWKDAKRNGQERAFCWENFLSPITLRMMDDMRNQFIDLLSDIGFVNKTRGAKAYNQYSDDLEMVCAILCAGLYPNVVQCKQRGKRTAFYSKEVGKVDIHPSSVNAGVHIFPLPYIVYSEKVKTTSVYIRDSTNISDYSLLLFGGNLAPSKTGEGIEMLDGYLHFSASKSVLLLIQTLREELTKLLGRKIEEPELDIPAEGKGVVAAAVELLHSQNIRL
ncbi:DExH-box ATP-dependent RNA helicase DExH1 isoform X2 [Magnolia sinica]|uniref:DExH-box ATP-dependent RNA helicase DExH1 isoform X2 n=1 Tax=Magnolia sinica TaxID=86752 RepID=UPI002659F81A|nr:DExH-box ATP-dependent RNA helicase DExH1 isoform X2 [Magnolia sinica]